MATYKKDGLSEQKPDYILFPQDRVRTLSRVMKHN